PAHERRPARGGRRNRRRRRRARYGLRDRRGRGQRRRTGPRRAAADVRSLLAGRRLPRSLERRRRPRSRDRAGSSACARRTDLGREPRRGRRQGRLHLAARGLSASSASRSALDNRTPIRHLQGAGMNTIAATRPGGALARWASLGGVLYVVLFVIGIIVMVGDEPNSSGSPAKIIAYYSKSSHRDKISLGWVIAGLGVFFFLWFLAALRQTVRRLEGGDGFLTALTTIGGAIYATLAFAALALNAGIRTMSDDTF